MTDFAADPKNPASDFAETIAFLRAFPRYVEQLPEGSLREEFKTLPEPVRRLIFNLSAIKWSNARENMRQAGIDDQLALDSIRPLVDRFRPVATALFERARARAELKKEYAGIDGIRPRHLFEMQLGAPILHLAFLDEDENILFEAREATPDMMSNAVGIMVAVAQSFELCRDRKLPLQRSLIEHVKLNLTSLLVEVRKIALALGLQEEELLSVLTGSHSPEPVDAERGGVQED